MRLTKAMHDSVLNSSVGQEIDRLIREETARGGVVKAHPGGNIIQALWKAFMAGAKKPKSKKK